MTGNGASAPRSGTSSLFSAEDCIEGARKYHAVTKPAINNNKMANEMPFKVPEIKLLAAGADMNVRAERVAAGLSVDDQGQVYVMTTTRPKTKEEKEIGSIISIVTKTGETVMLPKERVDVESTDLYRLLVFNSSGKIIAAEPLGVFCENIKVHRDRLFVIDTYATMKIYEYRIKFN